MSARFPPDWAPVSVNLWASTRADVERLSSALEGRDVVNVNLHPKDWAILGDRLEGRARGPDGVRRVGHGSLCGIPVFVSSACPEGRALFVTRPAPPRSEELLAAIVELQ